MSTSWNCWALAEVCALVSAILVFECLSLSLYIYLCRRCQQGCRIAAQNPDQQPRTWNWDTFWRQACREPMSSTSRTGERGKQLVMWREREIESCLSVTIAFDHYIHFSQTSSLERASVAQQKPKAILCGHSPPTLQLWCYKAADKKQKVWT